MSRPTCMNASCTPEDHARETNSISRHNNEVDDGLRTLRETIPAEEHHVEREPPENPLYYWQKNGSLGGLQVVPETTLEVAPREDNDKEALESVDELKKKGMRHWIKQRACGVPLWLLLLLAMLLIIGAVVGGTLGGLRSKKKEEDACHLVGNSTICAARPTSMTPGQTQPSGTPHPLPVNGTYYFLANQHPVYEGLVLSVGSNGAMNGTKIGTQANVSSELWTFVNYEDLALIDQSQLVQGLAYDARKYRRDNNITSPVYIIRSGTNNSYSYLRLHPKPGAQPYLEPGAPDYFWKNAWWWLEDRWDYGDFYLKSADHGVGYAAALWDIKGNDRDATGRLIMTNASREEARLGGAWTLVPFQ